MSGDSPDYDMFVRGGLERGGFETEDALAAILPLMHEVAALHENGRVAPLRGAGSVQVRDGLALTLGEGAGGRERMLNTEKIHELDPPAFRAIEVVGEVRGTTHMDDFSREITNLEAGRSGDEIKRPVYLPGHVTWEHAIGHHDELTDVLSLGMILASLACGLDFSDADDVELFANSRSNLFALATRLHPVVAAVIVEMTELSRRRRAQDIPSLVKRLETYRDQPVDVDLARLPGLEGGTKSARRAVIQTHLRDRLFEISRRNRLLHFKTSQSTLNLTVASVPLVLDYRNVKPSALFYWHEDLAREVVSGATLPLNRWLRGEEAPYLPGQLDKLISEARRDRAEYGFSQLRMVVCFLRWNNLREAPEERIHSPLLLLPVDLAKTRGVKDRYTLEAASSEAEVNPALRHHLKQLYNLDLPETVDLRTVAPADFHAALQAAIHATEPGVTLSLVDKPRIQLIHERAKQRVDQYRRRLAKSGRARRKTVVDYSYEAGDFRPLGLQVFRAKVMPSPLPLRDLAGAPPVPRMPQMAPNAAEPERGMFALMGETQGNPYAWEFDLCSVTLANFNYRKMTLVRDYNQLIENAAPNAAFDRLFSLDPKPVDPPPIPAVPPSGQHLIIAADATQTGAIARARAGGSFIIQGPPGTGKSQTITNLIADYAALGKRVLFVCEKRAAIDVVFHRLRQQGLDELCCLIHDSQTDKREFIQNLRQTYEHWIATVNDPCPSVAGRKAALATLESELDALDRFTAQLDSIPDEAGVSVSALYQRLITLRGIPNGNEETSPAAAWIESFPHYREWLAGSGQVLRLAAALEEAGADPVFANHPFSRIADRVIQADEPVGLLEKALDGLENKLSDLSDALARTGLDENLLDSPPGVGRLLDAACTLRPLARKGLLGLLDVRSVQSTALADLCGEFATSQKMLDAARSHTAHWREKLTPADTAAALAQAAECKGILAVLKPSWWRLRKVLDRCYDFSKHAVKPTWKTILGQLAAEHSAAAAVKALSTRCAGDFIGEDPVALRDSLLQNDSNLSAEAAALRAKLMETRDAAALVEDLAALAPGYATLRADLASILCEPESRGLTELAALTRDLREDLDALPAMLPAMRDLLTAPPKLVRAVRDEALCVEDIESRCAGRTLAFLYHSDRSLHRFDGHLLRLKTGRVAAAHAKWLEHNAAWIKHRAKERFAAHLRVTNQAASALTAEEKVFKKTYNSGRRELEHEFGKTMRYKAIRELAAGESGQVIRDLKPIWLMSPLSVSDTLPLDASAFDVVIFDEASQIPMEEAVPAAYRAEQVIVVGDEMQLPPTSFFSASGGGDDDEISMEDDEGEKVSVLMDADSFLAQSARNLPNTLLAWHYRSRHEALIGFSNAAFYGGELYTVPDRRLAVPRDTGLRLTTPEAADTLVPAILSQPLSFVRCENMPYGNRRNPGEAASIAKMVRILLGTSGAMSIGIAAFSEAQQDEIERALDALGADDPAFGARLESEFTREEDGQFCGLFVKNLENIQGDERDIILMSVCYGRDVTGRMLMNFGPINQRGGEKRLNVIFSRARKHMVLLSGIRHTDITNDYNDGARALKDFLHYAECHSRGDETAALRVLESLNPHTRKSGLTVSGNPVAGQIAAVLGRRGWIAEPEVGQSRFRCDLAVRAADSPHHQAAVLIDGGGSGGALERFHTRPSVLEAFGWKVVTVLARDWWHQPQTVIDRIERVLRNEPPEEDAPVEEPDTGEIPAEEASPPSPFPASGEDQPVPQPPTGEPTVVRKFEFVGGGSSKFWQIAVNGVEMTVTFGRIGTTGQKQTRSFPDAPRTAREAAKLIAEKLKKGYREVG